MCTHLIYRYQCICTANQIPLCKCCLFFCKLWYAHVKWMNKKEHAVMKDTGGRKEMQSASQFSTCFTDTINKSSTVKIRHCQKLVSLFYKSLLTEDVLMFTSGRTFWTYMLLNYVTLISLFMLSLFLVR